MTGPLEIAPGPARGVSGCHPGVPDFPEDPGTPVFLGQFCLLLSTFEPPRSLQRLSLRFSRVGVCFHSEWRPRTVPKAVTPASGSPEMAKNAVFYDSFSVPRFEGPGNSQTPSLTFGPVQMESRSVPASDPAPPGIPGIPENRQKGPGKRKFRYFLTRIVRARSKPKGLP